MKKIPVGVQLYSLREAAKTDFTGVLEKVASFGYDGVEFAGLNGFTATDIRRKLDGLGLTACSAHGAFPAEGNLREIVTNARTLGYSLHVTNLGQDRFASADACGKTADALVKACALLKNEGLTLGYHNHWWEFLNVFDGKPAYELVFGAAVDVALQIDTYWAAVGGREVPRLLKDLGQRIVSLHIKDGPMERGKPMTAVGTGKMQWGPVLASAGATGARWLIVELDECATDMFEAVEQSARYLRGTERKQ